MKSEFHWKPVQLSLLSTKAADSSVFPVHLERTSLSHPAPAEEGAAKVVVGGGGGIGPGSQVCRAMGAALCRRHLRFFLRTSTHFLSFSLSGGPDSLKAIYFSHPRQLRSVEPRRPSPPSKPHSLNPNSKPGSLTLDLPVDTTSSSRFL